jgi:hypothetical protein
MGALIDPGNLGSAVLPFGAGFVVGALVSGPIMEMVGGLIGLGGGGSDDGADANVAYAYQGDANDVDLDECANGKYWTTDEIDRYLNMDASEKAYYIQAREVALSKACREQSANVAYAYHGMHGRHGQGKHPNYRAMMRGGLSKHKAKPVHDDFGKEYTNIEQTYSNHMFINDRRSSV